MQQLKLPSRKLQLSCHSFLDEPARANSRTALVSRKDGSEQGGTVSVPVEMGATGQTAAVLGASRVKVVVVA